MQGLIKSGVKSIYISPFEHNAVTRTLYNFSKEKLITVSTLAVQNDLTYDIEKSDINLMIKTRFGYCQSCK